MADGVFRLGLYESLPLLRPTNLGAGTHTFSVDPAGNSILASLLIKSIGAGVSVSAEWYDHATDDITVPQSKRVLANHPSRTTTGVDNRVISRIHNRAYIDITITGGSATLAMMVSVVTDFPQEAPFLDGQTADTTVDKGQAIVVYDPDDNKFYLLRGSGGILSTTAYPAESKQLKTVEGLITGTIGVEETIISTNVPVGKTWLIRSTKVICRTYGKFRILINGISQGRGVTSPVSENVDFVWQGGIEALAGQSIEVKYEQTYGPFGSDLAGFLEYFES